MKHNYKGNYKDNKAAIEVSMPLISFKEKDIFFIYSPSIDVTGYGNTEVEAKQSFNTALEEFFRYTLNKNTFESELKRLGWKFTGKTKKQFLVPPFLDDSLRDNKYLSDIMREKDFRSFREKVEIPSFA